MATYDPAAYAQQYAPAWNGWNIGNVQQGLPPELLAAIQQQQSSSIGHLDSDGNWVNSPNPNAHIVSPDGRYQLATYQSPTGTQYQINDLIDGGPGKPLYGFDQSGKFLGERTGAKAMSGAQGLAMVAGAGLGFGALAGMMGAGGAAASGLGSGSGAFLGEGALSGIGAWDGALGSGAGFIGEGASSGIGAWDRALAGGGTSSMGAGGAGWMDALKAGGSKVLGGGGGGGGGFSWTDLIEPAISLAGGAYSANQAGKASDAQVAAAREAAAQFKPWVDNGAWAINQGGTLAGRNGPEAAKNALMLDPGYQFRLDQGNKALERATAARGGLGSGKYLKDAMSYNQGQASQEYGNSFNRLMALAGMGQTATGSAADYGTQGANAQAAGYVGKANALTGAIGQGMSMYNNNQQANQNNALMRQILGY
jgi:hypothetical protein